ncbi:protein kinase, partial [Planctomycetota bacterium]
MAVSLEQFVENLVRSGLFTADEVAAFQQTLPADRQPQNPQDLARELHKAGRLTRYQAAQVFQGKTKGLVLGDYVIQDEIGAGGMGQVFKAWRRDMERTVALKILPAKAMGSPEAIERFRREVKAAARLEHPNIVTAHDAGEAEDIHFLVMQYIDGKDLAHVVAERGPLPVEEAVDYTIQAAKGLECAHEQGVIHRDVKPGNLLLDRKGTVKILDMGLARIDQPPDPRAQTAPEALTESGQVMGTYDYMAPEQAQDTHGADHRADIYALGCTLFRLLTGQKPYQGDTPVTVLLAHCQAPIPSLCELREEVSPELDGVVQKMLAKDPANRQQSMEEVITELEACIRPAAPPVPEPPTPPPAGSPAASSSSSDSALKAFLRRLSGGAVAAQATPTIAAEETAQVQREQETSVLAGQGAAPPASEKKTLPWLAIGGGIVAAVLILVVSFALLGRGGPEQDKGREVAQGEQKKDKLPETSQPTTDQSETCLLIQWPESERGDAKLEIDGVSLDLLSSDIQSDQKHLKIPTDPGSHRIWIARRGFAPYEVQVAVNAGQDLEIKPEWEPAPGLAEGPEPGSEQAAAEPGTRPTTPEPSQMAEERPPSQPEPETPKPDASQLDPEEEKRLAAEQRYTEALAPSEEMVAAWKFRDALSELEKLSFEEKAFAARLASRREQVGQLAQLKSRIIEALNTADPPVTKADLKIRGVGGDIVKADENGITAQLKTKTETRAWNDLGEQSTEPLLRLVIDPQKPEDLLAAGLLAMACKDTSLAESYFDQARQLGVDIGPYLAPLVQTAFARAGELLEKGQFAEADALLMNVEAEYSETPWFATHRRALMAARTEAKQGIYEAEAEKLYTEAAELFEKEQLFDVKAIVEKLKGGYADSQAVTDAVRQPLFAEMDKAVADLGQFITVRQDGEGDFTSIQAAIDAAPPNSLIEIGDNGTYNEQIEISTESLTLRGREGRWPVITSVGPNTHFGVLLAVRGPATLERVVLLHHGSAGSRVHTVFFSGQVQVRSSVISGPRMHGVGSRNSVAVVENSVVLSDTHAGSYGYTLIAKDSLLLGRTTYTLTLDNVLVKQRTLDLSLPNCALHGSTVAGQVVTVDSRDAVIADSIVPLVDASRPETRVEHCNAYGHPAFANKAKPGKGCISQKPQFRDPA